jgi:SSS family solute:Na+ symporter
MAITFLAIVLLMVIISLAKSKKEKETHSIEVDTSIFKVSGGFIIGSIIISGILIALYTVYW